MFNLRIAVGQVVIVAFAAAAFAQHINLATAPTGVAVHYVGSKPNSVPSQTVAPAGDFNGDGFGDFIIGSPLEKNGQSQASGRVYLCLGKAAPGNYTLSDFNVNNTEGFSLSSSVPGEVLGYSVAGLGDVNGDNYDDYAVAGWGDSAYIVFGKAGPFSNLTDADFEPSNSHGILVEGVRFGSSSAGTFMVGKAGDVNGDGFSDFMVAANAGTEGTSSTRTGVYVLFGKASLKNIHLADFVSSDELGFYIECFNSRNRGFFSAGDFNNDGYDDVLVTYDDWTANVVFGKASGHNDVLIYHSGPTRGTLRVDTRNSTSSAIQCLAGAGDFNGDGYDDIAVGYGRLTAYIVYGRSMSSDTSATVWLDNLSSPDPDALRIDLPSQTFGSWMNFAGDVNKDGFSDIMLTESKASHNGLNESGSTYVVYGRAQAKETMDLHRQFRAGVDGFRIDGRYANPDTIPVISSAGDINGDGFDDLLIDQHLYVGNTAVVFGAGSGQSAIADWQLWN